MNTALRILLVFSLCHSLAFAQDGPDYATKNIPAALLAHANTVMRAYETHIDIVSPQEVYVKEHYVLNAQRKWQR